MSIQDLFEIASAIYHRSNRETGLLYRCPDDLLIDVIELLKWS